LVPSGDAPLSEEQLTRSLRALARLHATFYGFPAKLMAGLGLCIPSHWLTLLAPVTAEREAASVPRDPVTSHILPGWDAFARVVPDAWAVVAPLLADPLPVVLSLRACPDTFVHGDAKVGNLAFSGEQVMLLDWSQTLRAPGGLDLGWYLAVNSARLPVSRAAAIEVYRAAREEHGRLPTAGEQWERELALSLLAGTLRLGWAKALGASSDDPAKRARERAELDYWADAALAAQRWLG
ncbi:MAG: aminoglycoside phosphotransferase family protein, partial [Chloroflexota bacterium]|nr:aminoglycoside phosphotransferase family protein [Chloroflexota bacterium]